MIGEGQPPPPPAPPEYDHARAFQTIFGIDRPDWFLGKAGRELARYQAAGEDNDTRTDALLNFSSTLIALEDWTQPGGDMRPSAWRALHRGASPAYGLMCLVALLGKHRALHDGRLPNVRLEQTDLLEVWSEDARAEEAIEILHLAMPQARVRNVRTHVEDDEIVGYTLVLEMPGLRVNGITMALPMVMQLALHYWRGVVTRAAAQ